MSLENALNGIYPESMSEPYPHRRLYLWLADYLFTDRYQTHKWVSDKTGVEVDNKSLRHFDRLVLLVVLSIIGFVFSMHWLSVYRDVTQGASSLTIFVVGGVSAFVLPFSLFYLLVTYKLVRSFIRKRRCEQCGDWTRYPHDLARAKPDTFPTKSDTHYFCSIECRESFERANMDYPQESYYSTQTERDQQHNNAVAEREILGDNDL